MKTTKFIPFIVAGHPTLEASTEAIEILIAEGADLIELGVPFSDALADGPVIQAASEKAAQSVALGDVFALAERALARHPGFPLVLFTYYNPIFRMGLEAFARRAKEVGIHAVLVVDLPVEESVEYRAIMKAVDVGTVFLASPTTSERRLKAIVEASTAFIYLVSRAGVTGEQKALSETLAGDVARVRALTDKPLAIGFGISTAEHARAVARLGDAVVVGSAMVRILDQPGGLKTLRQFTRELVAATRAD